MDGLQQFSAPGCVMSNQVTLSYPLPKGQILLLGAEGNWFSSNGAKTTFRFRAQVNASSAAIAERIGKQWSRLRELGIDTADLETFYAAMMRHASQLESPDKL